MTKLFTKLASGVTALALVASFVPVAFAQEVIEDVVADEEVSGLVTNISEESAPEESAPVEVIAEEVVNQEAAPVAEEEAVEEAPAAEEATVSAEAAVETASAFFVDETSFENLVAPEPANVTINRSVTINDSWVTDRHEPSDWENGSVQISGSLDVQQQGSNFYRTEGRKTSLNNVSSVEASLYIDPAWDNTAVRAGIWATGNGATPEWGILEYTTSHNYVAGNSSTLTESATFRTWDSATGTWTPVMTAVPGQTYALRVEVSGNNWYYYINDALVGEVAVSGTDTDGIKEVILNHYNYGLETVATGEDFGNRSYAVQWSGMNVDHSFATLGEAVVAANSGDIIVLNDNVIETATVNVNKTLTINGNGNTLTAGSGVTGSAVLITASDVVVNDLVVDAAHLPIQGIQAYVASNVTLDGVTAKNANKSGIMVNGSTVTVNDVTTSGNLWHGINVDQGSNVTSAAVLTVIGNSSHSEAGPAIFVDNTAKGSVIAGGQYTIVDQAPAKAYYLSTVKNEAELTAALANQNIPTITLGDSFSVSSQVTVNRAVSILGNGKTITASGALSGSVILITGSNYG